MNHHQPPLDLHYSFFTNSTPRKILLLDGDLLAKRSLRPLLRMEPLSAGKDGGRAETKLWAPTRRAAELLKLSG